MPHNVGNQFIYTFVFNTSLSFSKSIVSIHLNVLYSHSFPVHTLVLTPVLSPRGMKPFTDKPTPTVKKPTKKPVKGKPKLKPIENKPVKKPTKKPVKGKKPIKHKLKPLPKKG